MSAGNDVVLQLPNTNLYVDSTYEDKGKGVLSIEEGCLQWTSDSESSRLVLTYPSITIHAISRDTDSFPHQCLFVLSTRTCNDDIEEDTPSHVIDPCSEITPPHDGEPVYEEDDDEENIELRFVPHKKEDLEEMYSAICKCQLLYPDSELSEDSYEDNDDDDEVEPGDDEWGEEGMVEVDEGDNDGTMYFTSAEEGLPHLTEEGQAVLQHLENVLVMPGPDEFVRLVENGQQDLTDNEQFEDA